LLCQSNITDDASRTGLRGPYATPPLPSMHYVHVEVSLGFDSIGWDGLPSDPSLGCITPPPFGKQCTLPRSIALAACINLPGCVAFTCPSQEPYRPGGAGKVQEPICQLRGHSASNEKRHGMCKPSGCVSAVLSRRSIEAGHAWASSRPPRTRLVHLDSASAALIAKLVQPSPTWPGAYQALAPGGGAPRAHLFAVALRSRGEPGGSSARGRRLAALAPSLFPLLRPSDASAGMDQVWMRGRLLSVAPRAGASSLAERQAGARPHPQLPNRRLHREEPRKRPSQRSASDSGRGRDLDGGCGQGSLSPPSRLSPLASRPLPLPPPLIRVALFHTAAVHVLALWEGPVPEYNGTSLNTTRELLKSLPSAAPMHRTHTGGTTTVCLCSSRHTSLCFNVNQILMRNSGTCACRGGGSFTFTRRFAHQALIVGAGSDARRAARSIASPWPPTAC
jgi:hypothetical protein